MQHLQNRKNLILELGYPETQFDLLAQYVDLLWKSNEELNLISRQMTFEDLIDNHVIDCLLAVSSLPQFPVKWADLGSGGGLPGVLYALAKPQVQIHLYEKSPKKREFLQLCQRIAPNIQLQAEVTHDLKGTQLVTARAFKPLDVILDMTRVYYSQGGSYFLLKGRAEKIEEEIREAQKKFKGFKCEVKKLVSPLLDVERHIVQIN